ncbi:MAG: hypothetical protein JWO03_1883 [Bacteroidetes bacterium]|nr:hypothetical protein [Bacteroidota bacterium]
MERWRSRIQLPMGLRRTWFLTLVVSAVIGAGIFIGLPALDQKLGSGLLTFNSMEDDDAIWMGLYIAYLILQVTLTTINSAQIPDWNHRSQLIISGKRQLKSLYMTGVIMYLLLFGSIMLKILTASSDISHGTLALFIISLPFTFCCSVSVIVFWTILKKLYKPKRYESQDDPSGISRS